MQVPWHNLIPMRQQLEEPSFLSIAPQSPRTTAGCRVGRALLLVAVAASGGCLRPPASATGVRGVPVEPLPEGAVVLWDGVATPRYQLARGGPRPWEGGGGWAACEAKPACQASFVVSEGTGVAGGRGLQLHGEGAGWVGGGWNWTKWRGYASNDLSRFGKLSLQIRVRAASATPTDLSGPQIALASKNSEQASTSVRLRTYAPALLDGRWHKISVPLSAFATSGAGPGFDLAEAWELRISMWSSGPKRFDIYLDQVIAER